MPRNPNSLRRAITAPPNPLSALNDPIVHTGHTTVAVREQVRRWVQHVVVKSAWAGDVRWVCSRAGWSGTRPHSLPPGSQAACASCRFPALDGRFERTPLHTATRRPQHDGGTPWSVPAVLRVGCRGCGCVSCPVVCQNGDGGGSWAGAWWASWSELVVWCCSVSSVRSSPSAKVTWYPY